MDLSNVTMVGRLTRDAELKYAQSGTAVCKFSVAVNGYKPDETDFWDVTLFGKQGEAIGKYLVKGKRVAMTGRMRKDHWEKDGVKHERAIIIADNVQLLDGGDRAESAPASKPQPKGRPAGYGEAYDGDLEDAPF